MHSIKGSHFSPNGQQGCALTIGNFDGVHRGHAAVLTRLREISDGLPCCVLTFHPHPRAYFAELQGKPEQTPPRISTLRDKITELLRWSDIVHLMRFDQHAATMGPEEFIRRILIDRLQARCILVGRDFRFGSKRAGDIQLLERTAPELGCRVHTIDDVLDDAHKRCSSSRIRELLALGDMESAADYLGRRYVISGRVVHGKKLGRQIGFPTINIPVPNDFAIRLGVYIVRVHGLSNTSMAGIANIGRRPTTDSDDNILLEVHLLDQDLDAYGKLVSVEFIQFLREEKKFPSLETMIGVMHEDMNTARRYFDVNGL